MKVGIIGSSSFGETSLIEAMVKAVELKTGEQVEFVNIHAKDAEFLNQKNERFDRGINITNEMRCNLYTPPMSRSERRKLQRKNGQKRK